MPIAGIVNGYYRSGTTLLWWIIKSSNPDMLHLYEPLSPLLFSAIDTHQLGRKDRMHGVPLWDDYLFIPEDTLSAMRSKHRDFTVVFNPSEVYPYLDIIDSIDKPVILQPNRMHFIVDDVSARYGVNWVHIIRNPADTFIDLVKPNVDLSIPMIERFAEGKLAVVNPDYFFWVGDMYRVISRNFAIRTDKNDFFGKFLIVWTFSNLIPYYYAVLRGKGKSKGLIVYFEELVYEPVRVAESISKHLGVRINHELLNTINRSEAYKYSSKLESITVRKLDELGLTEFAKMIYSRCSSSLKPEWLGGNFSREVVLIGRV